MTNNLVRVYQDIDGCLNAENNAVAWGGGYASGSVSVFHDNRGVRSSNRRTQYLMQWNSFLVDRMNALFELPVELVWLTTWRSDAPEVGRMMGFAPNAERVLHPLSGITTFPSLEWKLQAILAEQRDNPSPFVWIEDEIPMLSESEKTAVESLGGFLIAPGSEDGVSPEQMTLIEDYVKTRS
jgi:hypothetical protein